MMEKSFAARLLLVLCTSLTPCAPLSLVQTTPFLSDDEIRTLSNEISGDRLK